MNELINEKGDEIIIEKEQFWKLVSLILATILLIIAVSSAIQSHKFWTDPCQAMLDDIQKTKTVWASHCGFISNNTIQGVWMQNETRLDQRWYSK
jgi:hypothetical protein